MLVECFFSVVAIQSSKHVEQFVSELCLVSHLTFPAKGVVSFAYNFVKKMIYDLPSME